MMDEFDKELKEDFLEEASQLLEQTEQAFLRLENESSDLSLLNEIFRLAHNLKGSAMAVGFSQMGNYSHAMENLILKLKTGEMEITDAAISMLLQCLDYLNFMVTELKQDLEKKFNDVQDKIDVLDDFVNSRGVENEQENIDPIVEDTESESVSTDVKYHDIDDVLKELQEEDDDEVCLESKIIQEDVKKDDSSRKIEKTDEEQGEGLKFHFNHDEVEESSTPISAPKTEVKETRKVSNEDESIRVSLSRVENLNNYVGELVILQTVLEQRKGDFVHDELMAKSIRQLGKLSKEIQEISMSLRMVPIKQTLQKMQRIVRDTSKTLGKKVKLEIKGEETEVDKTILEKLGDPLVHIVRNAVDHGLETVERRIESGKDEIGQITLQAFHQGNNLVIEVKDDGGGINPDIIKEKAIKKGVIRSNSNLSNDEVIQLIFNAGFSTKEQVTDVSGRGVGMDVVKSNIESLSGSVIVKSEVGKGSIFRIELPLTMAIIEALIVHVSGQKFVLPLNQVQESVGIRDHDLKTFTGGGECINLRGEVIPVFRISSTLIGKSNNESNLDIVAIITEVKGIKFAVIVDEIILQQQVVVKNLGPEIKNQKGFMGSTILGDGRPSLILDIQQLFESKIININKKSAIKDAA